MMKQLRHLNLAGWLWILLGGFWFVLVFSSLTTRNRSEPAYIVSELAWRQEVTKDVLEAGFFLATALCGVAIIRCWRFSRFSAWVFSSLWLFISILFFTPATSGDFAGRVFFFGPSLAVSLYTLHVLWLTYREPSRL